MKKIETNNLPREEALTKVLDNILLDSNPIVWLNSDLIDEYYQIVSDLEEDFEEQLVARTYAPVINYSDSHSFDAKDPIHEYVLTSSDIGFMDACAEKLCNGAKLKWEALNLAMEDKYQSLTPYEVGFISEKVYQNFLIKLNDILMTRLPDRVRVLDTRLEGAYYVIDRINKFAYKTPTVKDFKENYKDLLKQNYKIKLLQQFIRIVF